jgi:hypothetical protein
MCWFILSVRIIEMNYWVELIDMLIYFIGNDYQNELLDWMNWYVDLFYQ